VPGDRPRIYAVYVDDQDVVWASDWGANALVRFDPKTEKFDVFKKQPQRRQCAADLRPAGRSVDSGIGRRPHRGLSHEMNMAHRYWLAVIALGLVSTAAFADPIQGERVFSALLLVPFGGRR